jgi:hypothetical protein
MLGVAPASLTIMKAKEELGKLQIANFVKRVSEATSKDILRRSMEVIVEYFPIDRVQKSSKWYPFEANEHPELRRHLESNVGIYSFYNSEGRIIYLGKAEINLFKEMIQTYNRSFNGKYIIFAVAHPRDRFKPKPDGTVRRVSKQSIKLADTASFFFRLTKFKSPLYCLSKLC